MTVFPSATGHNSACWGQFPGYEFWGKWGWSCCLSTRCGADFWFPNIPFFFDSCLGSQKLCSNCNDKGSWAKQRSEDRGREMRRILTEEQCLCPRDEHMRSALGTWRDENGKLRGALGKSVLGISSAALSPGGLSAGLALAWQIRGSSLWPCSWGTSSLKEEPGTFFGRALKWGSKAALMTHSQAWPSCKAGYLGMERGLVAL